MEKYLSINSTSGLLTGVKQLASPHCDARPAGLQADLIVIHAISLPPEEYGNEFIDDLFCGCLDKNAHPYFGEIAHLRVSSHVLVKRDGSLTQYVPFHCRAWHAGISSYQGKDGCNDFSIGIELEGCDKDNFSDKQYSALNQLIRALCQSYSSLSWERVTGHSDIAPGRKTDPGPCFDWARVSKNA